MSHTEHTQDCMSDWAEARRDIMTRQTIEANHRLHMADIQPVLSEDDSAVYEGRRLILNRIDQEWTCDAVVNVAFDHPQMIEVPEYCGLLEYDPFTNRCWDHTPGNLTSGHM